MFYNNNKNNNIINNNNINISILNNDNNNNYNINFNNNDKTTTIIDSKLFTCSPCWAAGDPGWTAVTKIPTSFPPVSRMPTLPFFWKEMKRGSGL
jgi:hypothetical protein